MKNTIILVAIAAMFLATAGCANGPLRRFFRGSACNSCQPPMSAPFSSNTATGCANGACGTGVYDQAPASIPASNLGAPSAPMQYYNDPSMGGMPPMETYGNTDMITPPQIGPVNGN